MGEPGSSRRAIRSLRRKISWQWLARRHSDPQLAELDSSGSLALQSEEADRWCRLHEISARLRCFSTAGRNTSADSENFVDTYTERQPADLCESRLANKCLCRPIQQGVALLRGADLPVLPEGLLGGQPSPSLSMPIVASDTAQPELGLVEAEVAAKVNVVANI